jgi:hypothetical protein
VFSPASLSSFQMSGEAMWFECNCDVVYHRFKNSGSGLVLVGHLWRWGAFATWLNHGGTSKVVFIQIITCGKVSFLCVHE